MVQIGPIQVQNPKSEVFVHFLLFESLDFSDFAYYDRQAWYLAGTGGTGTGGPVAEEKFPTQIWAQNGVFGHYLNFDSSDSSDIAHSDFYQWYLAINGALCCWKIFIRPNWA